MTDVDPVEPEETSRVWMFFVGFALLVIAVMIYTMIRFKMHESDPGGEACDRMTELVAQHHEDGAALDAAVDKIAAQVAASYKKREAPADEPVEITGSTRDDRCRVMFLRMTNVMTYPSFDKTAKCIAAAATAGDQRTCLAAALID
jgi:hypothetical protein